MKKKFSLVVALLLLMPLFSFAATPEEEYTQGETEYKAENWPVALKLFQQSMKHNGGPVGNEIKYIEICEEEINKANYAEADELFNKATSKKQFQSAKKAFEKLGEYRDAQARVKKCDQRILGIDKVKVKIDNPNFDRDGEDTIKFSFDKNLMKKVKDLNVKTKESWLKIVNDNGTVTLTATRNEKPEARTATIEISGQYYDRDTTKTLIGSFITYCKVSQASNETVFLPVIKLASTTEGVETFAQAIQCNDDWKVSNNPTWVEAYKEGDALKLKYKASDAKRSGDLVIKTKTDGKEIKFCIVQEKYVPQPEPEPNPVDGQGGSSQIADEDLDAKIAKVNSSSVSDYSFGTTQVSTDQVKEILDLYELLKNHENLTVTIYGNTCSIGSEKANEKVGLERAENAKAFLVGLGIAEERISVASKGESSPVADNSTAKGRAKNRRLTFNVK